jgi:hypothetical protein
MTTIFELLQVVQTVDVLSRHFGSGQCRQQQRRQNPNDGNDDEKFDERKRGRSRAGNSGVLFPLIPTCGS